MKKKKPFMTKFIPLILTMFIFYSCKEKTLSEKAIQAARQLFNATEQNDWNKVIDYSCPLKVKDLGGRDAMIKYLKNIGSRANVELGDIDEIKIINSTIYAKLYYNVIVDSNGNKFKVDMVGVSSDQGKSWWFIDRPLNIKQFEKYLPDLIGEIVLPSMQHPLTK